MNSGSIHDPIRGRIDRLAEIQSKSDRLLGARPPKRPLVLFSTDLAFESATSFEELRKRSQRGGQVSAEKRNKINESGQATLQPIKRRRKAPSPSLTQGARQ